MSKRCERLLEHVATPWCHFNDVIWNWARTQVSGRHRFSRLDEFRILIESLYFWKRFRFAKYTSSLFTSIPTKDIKLIVDILSSFLFVDLFRFFVLFGFICLGLVCLGGFFLLLFCFEFCRSAFCWGGLLQQRLHKIFEKGSPENYPF